MDSWSCYGFLIILSYPLVIGILFGVSYYIYNKFFIEGDRLFNRHQFYLYLLFLFIFFIAIFFISTKDGAINKIGIGLRFDIAQIMLLIIAMISGIGIYYIEKYLTDIIQKYLGQTRFLTKNTPSTNNKTSHLARDSQILTSLNILSILISFCEEFIWRGYLITILREKMHIWYAVGLSSIMFGINHYYFGISPIISKSFTGVLLGGMYIFSGTIWVPFLTHTVFNIYVWKKS